MDPENKQQAQFPEGVSPVEQNTNQQSSSQQSSGQDQQNNQAQEEHGTSTTRNIIAILLLIFFYFIGVIYVFLFTKWPRWAKILVISPIFLAFFAIIISVVLISLNSSGSSNQADDTRRQSEATQILNSIGAYINTNQGELPSGITSQNQEISSTGADICSDLVFEFILALPADPSFEITEISNCSESYSTGYYVVVNQDGSITVSAPNADGDVEISITR